MPANDQPLPQMPASPSGKAIRTPAGDANAVTQALAQTPHLDSLYVHVPFCFHKCHYCDFYSVVDGPDRDRQPAFVDALLAEMAARRQQVANAPRTIFFGGGTPTLLAKPLWDQLLEGVHAQGWFENAQEVTVEANPETIDLALMKTLRDGGINRVSMGAQSFNKTHLKTLERWHDPDKVKQAMHIAQDAGFDNLSLDLIFAIPGQTVADVVADLDEALALSPTHLSVYALIFEPNTPLTARAKAGQIQPVDELVEKQMFETVLAHLASHGFKHYEISNHAKSTPDDPAAEKHQAQHNLVYWQNGHWLGVGPGAASHIHGVRWKNQPSIDRYIEQAPHPPVTQVETLAPDERTGEWLMLGLRLLDGMPVEQVDERLQNDPKRQTSVAYLIEIGMLERTADRLRLTPQGLMVADSVLAELI